MIDRASGEGRYARPEREQRWLLSGLPDDRHQPVTIVDRYIRGTRLRLRRMQSGPDVVYKLGQKVRPHGGSPALLHLTNMYLSDDEYATLLALDGDEVHKTRWRWTGAQHDLVVDEFGGPLIGLVLAEIELGPDEPRRRGPLSAVADVTDDDRFSGGRLATMTPPELGIVLAGFGRDTPPPVG